MEHDIFRSSPLANTGNRTSEILQNEFMRLRRNQQKTQTDSKITDDLNFIAKYVNNNVSSPVPILKSLGILFFGRTAAFNLSILPALIICCRAKVMISLSKEGWTNVKSDQDTYLSSIIGYNQVKNWTVFNVPQKTNLSEYLEENQRLIATEHGFGLDHAPEEVLIGPGLPPQDILTEPHFPLVSIQYELALETKKVADFQPKKSQFSITDCTHFYVDAST
ncbi:hypothetical protein M9Y10_012414 [Tritrichomonas musculus]|uniref:Initiator binding domain-containing protein n=1 Tax=Tritrichomonas musculus TaxID=1915356 RepID=A0ABR2IDM6_9EUKA